MSLTPLADIYAIIPAAGQGRRIGGQGNKLLLELAGIPVLLYTLKIFQENIYIKEIIVPAAKIDILEIEKMAGKFNLDKVTVVQGGKERQDSVFNALEALPPTARRVVIHDGARPLLTSRQLSHFLETTADFQAAVMAVRPKDTIKRVDKADWVKETLAREELRIIQTPQVFERPLLEKVHKQAAEIGFYTTDDAALLEWQGYSVKVVEGSYENIKITTPEDFLLAEMILHQRKEAL